MSEALSREEPDPPPENVRADEEGQRLCLACGMCCTGDLYLSSWLYPEEVSQARSLGLKIVKNSACGHAFLQPCPRHIDDRCTVYDDPRKPSICSTYQCKLLKRYLRGEVGEEESLRYIRQARSMIASLRKKIGAIDGIAIWPQLGDWSRGGGPRELQLRMEVGMLMRLLTNIFMPGKVRADPVELLASDEDE